ncbi:hypothetical protein CAF53_12620 [Sphingobium sp. LB126]|nr:hypothetical protein CAF53_12620 [Sphingobium sp. LB126]
MAMKDGFPPFPFVIPDLIRGARFLLHPAPTQGRAAADQARGNAKGNLWPSSLPTALATRLPMIASQSRQKC